MKLSDFDKKYLWKWLSDFEKNIYEIKLFW